MNLCLASAYFVLNTLSSELIVQVATDALTEGFDTQSLRVLAGEMHPLMADVGPLFIKALTELNIPLPSRQEAALAIARYHAQRIVDGTISPLAGARQLLQEAYYSSGEPNSLVPFFGLVDEYEDVEDYVRYGLLKDKPIEELRRQTEAAIVEQAKELLK